jgi:hypothetical protein
LVTEEAEISDFIGNNPIAMIPYEYTKKYNAKEIAV